MKNLVDTMNLLVKHIINIDSKTVHLDGTETVTGDKAFTGGVTVGGYEPECVVDKGDDYIRYSSGLQICWGWAMLNGAITSTNKLVTFPVAFKSKPRIITTANANAGNAFIAVGWETETNFTIGTSGAASNGGTSWFAIGWWK